MSSVLKVDTIQTAAGGTPTAASLGLNISGSVLQRIHSVNSTQTSISNANGWVTALTATITPKYVNSLIYIDIDLHHGLRTSGEHQFGHRIFSTASSSYVALTSNNTSTFDVVRKPDDGNARGHYHSHYVGYEALNLGSISAITYNFQIASPSASYPNIVLNFASAGRSVITITEIAG